MVNGFYPSVLIGTLLLIVRGQLVAASSKVFYAEAVSYCSEARAIEVSKFLLEYDAVDKSITFDISAASVNPDLNAILEVSLVAYGMDLVNVSLNLCDELSGILCPLPTYDFIGSATIPLPSSVADRINVPSIAYKIPDLQATAVVRLVSQESGAEAACLKVDLSNGRTMRHSYVSWALAGIAFLSLAVGLFGGLVKMWKGKDVQLGRRKERLVAMLTFFQFVATAGLLSLDYPLVLDSYYANFAWAMGLIYVEPFQTAIDQTRLHTGGNLTQLAGNLVGGTLALSSKFRTNLVEVGTTDIVSLLNAAGIATSSSALAKRAEAIAIPDVQETNSLDSVASGIPRYLTNLGISPFNGFFTVFINFLLLICIFLSVVLLLSLLYYILYRRRSTRKRIDTNTPSDLVSIVGANALRLGLISLLPLLILAFFQWTIGHNDAWSPIVLSVLTVIPLLTALAIMAYRTVALRRRLRRSSLASFSDSSEHTSTTPLWNDYRDSRWWFFLPLMLATLCRAFFVAFAKDHGWVQSVGLVVIESLCLVLACIFTPYADKSSNGTHISIMIIRVVISGALITFNSSLKLNDIVRVAIGLVIAVLESIVVVGFFLLVLIDLVAVIYRAFGKPGDGKSSEKASMVEQRASMTSENR